MEKTSGFNYFQETDPLQWSLIDFLKWKSDISSFLNSTDEHSAFKFFVQKIANSDKDLIRAQKAQELLDNWEDIKCSLEVKKFWDNQKTQNLQQDIRCVKIQNELKLSQIESEDLSYVLDRSKELNYHASAIADKRYEIITESHKRNSEYYEDALKPQKRRSLNKDDKDNNGSEEENVDIDDGLRTPIDQIFDTSRNNYLLAKLNEEEKRAKSKIEPICSNIIDTTNKHLMERLQLKCDYRWKPTINNTTKYVDELIENSDSRSSLRQKLQTSFIPSGEAYSFNEHYEMNWVHRFADKLLSFFEAPRNPLLDKNSEGWINCHLLAPLIDDCFLTCEEIQVHRCEEISLASIVRKNLSREESEKKQSGHKIDIIFRIDEIEYFGAETYTDEDPQNSKPISYKQKLFREMKDQLDRLLKKLKFTKESIKKVKNIVLHGMTHGGFNGKMYIMYYDVDLKYYFAFETCQYRIGKTWGSVPESLMTLKSVLYLKNDILDVLSVVKEVKKVALRTKPEELFPIDDLPETTLTPKKK